MASCRRVLFLVSQDKESMSLSYEQKRSNRMKIQKYTHIKKKKRKETVINYHLLDLYMCWCAVTDLMQKPKR